MVKDGLGHVNAAQYFFHKGKYSMSAADFTRVARQLNGVVDAAAKHDAMSRVVLSGEGMMKREVPVNRGTLRRSITSRVERGGNRGIVGTNLPYARPVNDGSGIYGPKKARIVPTVKKALFWKGAAHPYRSVKGQRPNDFVGRTREKLRPVAERDLAAVFGARLRAVH